MHVVYAVWPQQREQVNSEHGVMHTDANTLTLAVFM